VRIPGFYDRMRGPTDTQISMVQALPNDDATLLANLGLDQFALGLSGFQRHMAEVFSPTCNIQGVIAGYTGPGTKTVLPNQALARLDLRLVPDQDPQEVYDQLRAYLDENGFEDIGTVMEPGPLYPARTDPDHPFVQLVIGAVGEAAGAAPIVWPSSAASGPMYSFTNGLGLPVVAIGCGNPASAAHGPNENIRLSDFLAGIKQIAQVLTRLGEQRAADLRPAPVPEAEVPVVRVFETDALFEMPPLDLDLLTPLDPADYVPAPPIPVEETPAPAAPRKRRARTRKPKS
jgi:acetylornithine deacetylase/succinyl-diaminopimelate desuccinylase-like protein